MGRVRIRVAVLSTLWVLSGCYRYTPVSVRVLDAETRRTIPGARISVRPVTEGFQVISPDYSTHTCDENGIAVVPLAMGYKRGNELDIRAGSYDEETVYVLPPGQTPKRDKDRIVPEKANEPVTVELFKLPPPELVLLLPEDIRGWVLVQSPHEASNAVRGIGHREQTVSFLDSRIAQIYDDLTNSHFRSRFKVRAETVSGQQIPVMNSLERPIAKEEICMWPLWYLDGGTPYFIGTQEQYLAHREFLWPKEWMTPRVEEKLKERYEVWAQKVRAELATPSNGPGLR